MSLSIKIQSLLRNRVAGRRWSFGASPRHAAAIACLSTALALTACGGGVNGGASIDIGVWVAGQPVSSPPSSGSQSVVMRAGQSIELDAREPVTWTLRVGNTSFLGPSTAVFYRGVTITQTALSPSRIALDTSASGYLPASVAVTLTAVSTYDAAIVGTVDVWVTN